MGGRELVFFFEKVGGSVSAWGKCLPYWGEICESVVPAQSICVCRCWNLYRGTSHIQTGRRCRPALQHTISRSCGAWMRPAAPHSCSLPSCPHTPLSCGPRDPRCAQHTHVWHPNSLRGRFPDVGILLQRSPIGLICPDTDHRRHLCG